MQYGKELPVEQRDSQALFEFKFEGTEEEFKAWLIKLVQEFMQWCDPKVHRYSIDDVVSMPWNSEGGIYGFEIEGKLFAWCKMYFFDDAGRYGQKRALLFRDHHSQSARQEVMRIAEAFEKYLKEKQVEFELFFLKR
ncbi:hypothetical protein HN858_04200 [Candidatus Falkowbacteria bacterium]|jgi:hypothetical protein|nr:hypothetical protein [Candidatus Falkowbacteria bacterium]MBT5502792.1 hypothetical protein [Candidatus Falkowbacteria bacterium]MBT7348847.1 hypothetical protein [Candidatus Falkowbacteria bacterium]MBT7500998.1 hypothetical protein [Candidatus Falkowbacteria bacterium]